MWTYFIWGAVLLIIILMLVRLRAKFSLYVCPKCQHQYTLSSAQEFLFPQVMYKKLSRCPNCKKFVAAGIIRNQETVTGVEQMQQGKTRAKNKGSHNQK